MTCCRVTVLQQFWPRLLCLTEVSSSPSITSMASLWLIWCPGMSWWLSALCQILKHRKGLWSGSLSGILVPILCGGSQIPAPGSRIVSRSKLVYIKRRGKHAMREPCALCLPRAAELSAGYQAGHRRKEGLMNAVALF